MTMLAIRDVFLFVKIVGHGYPLLVMHGGPGLDHTTLETLQPLANRLTLIFYDHRANGRSRSSSTRDTMPMRSRPSASFPSLRNSLLVLRAS